MDANTAAEMRDIHEHAQTLLSQKMAAVSTRVFSRVPMTDIYEKNPILVNPSIPGDLQLNFYLENYNLIMAYKSEGNKNVNARKDSPNFDIVRAIWFYQLDKFHSFSRYHEQIRYNVLAMILAFAHPLRDSLFSLDLSLFINKFVYAWMNSLAKTGDAAAQDDFLHLWYDGPYDLIKFTRTQRDAFSSRIGRLKELRSAPLLGMETFINGNHGLTEAEFRHNGPQLAFQFIAMCENAGDIVDIREAEAGVASLGIGEMSLEVTDEYLSNIDLGNPTLGAALMEIEEMAPPRALEGKESERWWDAGQALNLMPITDDELVKLASLLSL